MPEGFKEFLIIQTNEMHCCSSADLHKITSGFMVRFYRRYKRSNEKAEFIMHFFSNGIKENMWK
jgi:hypothetical protein